LKEKLIIKNFGPIKSVELELGRFNVLIGEQATGKSTVAKLLAVCRYFSYIINIDSLPVHNFEEGLNAWGLSEHLQENTSIFYECSHYSLSIEKKVLKELDRDNEGNFFEKDVNVFVPLLTPISKDFSDLINRLKQLKPQTKPMYKALVDFESLNWIIPTGFFVNDVASVMDNPFYLPAERGLQSIFSLGKNSIQNLSDALFSQLAKMDSIVRRFKDETEIEPLSIYYKNIDGRGYVRKKQEPIFYSLFNAATGYQSTIPTVLAIKYYYEARRRKKTFIIEEPEQNLFPTAQYELIKFFADKIKYNNGILLTTHSPYILSSLNNLMYAYTVGQNNHEDGNKIIEEKYWVNPDEVSAYQLLTDGTCVNILDKEERMIEADKIDEVSRIINKEFDDLMNIEFTEK
jgi:predicted ATP-dependent endonuclease of OLD family